MKPFLVTCEHASNAIPVRYQHACKGYRNLCQTHRAYDRGAYNVYRQFLALPGSRGIAATVSRLLIDVNRSLHHRNLFSRCIRTCPPALKQEIIARYYEPYRAAVKAHVQAGIRSHGQVIHVSIHTFTPVLRGRRRQTDIGLLYDPSRPREKELSRWYATALCTCFPQLTVRFNYPYQGTADGITSWLRTEFPRKAYYGIEMEINQAFLTRSFHVWRHIAPTLATLFRDALDAL